MMEPHKFDKSRMNCCSCELSSIKLELMFVKKRFNTVEVGAVISI